MKQCFIDHLCTCGSGIESSVFIAEMLRYYEDNWRLDANKDRWELMREWVMAEENRLDLLIEFAMRTVDEIGIMEHGSCVPGWLTPEGEEWVTQTLNNAKSNEEAEQ